MKDLIRHFAIAALLMLLAFAACNNDGLEQSMEVTSAKDGRTTRHENR